MTWQVVLHILSSVPTKDVIATSVLSKRRGILSGCLQVADFAPVLESLRLYIHDTSARLDIGTAFSRHVRELVMVLFHEDQTRVRFPSVLCSYNNTLEVLNLSQDLLLDFPSRVCFSALRELHLCLVIFKDEASVCNLLSGCPRLQDLVVVRIGNSDVGTYTIDVPSLQRLTLQVDGSHNRSGGGGGYVINTPSLKYLNMECLYCIDFCLIENAPELVEAKINHVSDIDNENILASLTSAKRLSFLPLYLPLEIKYPTGSIFYQLVSLELHIHKINGWNLLSFMLDSSPKLQILKLIGRYREECPVGWEWNQPKRVPECLLLHLETLVWTRYGWQREDEKQVATYILKNARQLKKASFPMEQEELEKSREMLNGLASLDRGSTSCHLVFE